MKLNNILCFSCLDEDADPSGEPEGGGILICRKGHNVKDQPCKYYRPYIHHEQKPMPTNHIGKNDE